MERDFWLAMDLLRDPKDHAEFAIVRDWVRSALQARSHLPHSFIKSRRDTHSVLQLLWRMHTSTCRHTHGAHTASAHAVSQESRVPPRSTYLPQLHGVGWTTCTLGGWVRLGRWAGHASYCIVPRMPPTCQGFGCCRVQGVCSDVRLEREKSILKQGGVQHLYARLAGTLRPGRGDAHLLVRWAPFSALVRVWGFCTCGRHASLRAFCKFHNGRMCASAPDDNSHVGFVCRTGLLQQALH